MQAHYEIERLEHREDHGVYPFKGEWHRLDDPVISVGVSVYAVKA